MLGFKRKKESMGPPDIGQEEQEQITDADNFNVIDNALDKIESPSPEEEIFSDKPSKIKPKKKPKISEIKPIPSYNPSSANESAGSNFELEKMNARLEIINSLISAFNERFSLVNQQIGEIRAMTIANEKNLSISNLDAKRVVDIVKEVNPEQLRIDYQKLEIRMNTLMERMESYKQYMDSIMEELKELKRRANLFEGTDALLKLDQDVKKDLLQIQKTNARVKMNADKSEQIFVELSKSFNENRKLSEMMTNIDASYSGLKKEIEKLTLDYKQVMNVDDFNDFKRNIRSKITVLENSFSEIERLKEENDKLSKGMGKILMMEKNNEEDIANLGLKTGSSDIQRIGDYEQKLFSVLEVIENLSKEVANIKEKLGIKNEVREEIPKREIIRQEGERKDNESRMNELLALGKQYLAERNLNEAWKIYKELSQMYSPVDDANRAIYYKIINFYDTLSDIMNKPVVVAEQNSEEQNLDKKYKQLSDY